jgi:hypothetical protein
VHPKKTGLSDPQGSQIHAVQEMQIRVGTLRSSYMTTPRPPKPGKQSLRHIPAAASRDIEQPNTAEIMPIFVQSRDARDEESDVRERDPEEPAAAWRPAP